MNIKEKVEDFIQLMETKPELCAYSAEEYITLYSFSLYLILDKDHYSYLQSFNNFFYKIIDADYKELSWFEICKHREIFIKVKQFRKFLELEIFK